MSVTNLDARRRAREEAAAAAAEATAQRTREESDRVHLATLAIIADTILVLEAGGVRDAINGLSVLYERLSAATRPPECTPNVHAGPVHVHPSGHARCAACSTTLNR